MTCGSPARAGDLGRRAGRATCAWEAKEIFYLITKIKSSIFAIWKQIPVDLRIACVPDDPAVEMGDGWAQRPCADRP
jgi:hypothetical protein